MKFSTRRLVTIPLLGLLMLPAALSAQSIGERMKQKAQERINQRTEEAMDRAIDAAENAVTCAVTDRKCIEKAEKAGKTVVDPDGNPFKSGSAPQAATASATATAKPGQGAWANYDFVPGERVLFAEDFSRDRVGNFPQRLELLGGAAEVVESGGRRWLRFVSSGAFAVALPEKLGPRFTLEFDVAFQDYANGQLFIFTDVTDPGELGPAAGNGGAQDLARRTYLTVGNRVNLMDLNGDNQRRLADTDGIQDDAAHRIRMHVDGKYVKVYVDERRVVNFPSAELIRTDRLYIAFNAHPDLPFMVGNLSINAGGRRMYDALLADGRVATQGILFDTGSDRIRPESTPTLKEITQMLQEHGDLRLMIEGHTDNVGQPAANQTLSEKRAAAVKAYLVSQGIDGARLQSKGLGATKPTADNTTPEGRQTNRRVELVRL